MFDCAFLIDTAVQYDKDGQPLKDSYGVDIPPKESLFEIPVEVKSRGQNEFYKANAAGLRDGLTLVTDMGNYTGQQYVVYRGKRYKIYRTFMKNNSIELYIEERSGV